MKERFFRNRTAVFTVVFVLLVGLVGILAPVIAPNDPYETNILNKFASYSLQYPLGTDQLGRCVLSRMIYGIRPTLGLALLTMFGTISLGAILGIMAGYFRGIVEEVIMRVVDVMLSFPSQIMVFAVVALLGVSVQNVIIANVFIKWAWYARMIRTGVMQYRDRNFVQFSRCVGMPERFILFRHLLPSITSDLVVLASLDVGWAIINKRRFQCDPSDRNRKSRLRRSSGRRILVPGSLRGAGSIKGCTAGQVEKLRWDTELRGPCKICGADFV